MRRNLHTWRCCRVAHTTRTTPAARIPVTQLLHSDKGRENSSNMGKGTLMDPPTLSSCSAFILFIVNIFCPGELETGRVVSPPTGSKVCSNRIPCKRRTIGAACCYRQTHHFFLRFYVLPGAAPGHRAHLVRAPRVFRRYSACQYVEPSTNRLLL